MIVLAAETLHTGCFVSVLIPLDDVEYPSALTEDTLIVLAERLLRQIKASGTSLVSYEVILGRP